MEEETHYIKKNEITLEMIRKKVEANGIGSLNDREARALERFRDLGTYAESKQTDKICFNLREQLKQILPKVFAAYADELKNGKGVAKVAAADRLKEWADAEGVGEEDAKPINCNFIEIESDEDGNIVPIKTA